MRLSELMSPGITLVGPPLAHEDDPFVNDWALEGAQLTRISFDAVTGTAALLLELRQGLYIREANTALLLVSNVREFRWNAPRLLGPLVAWSLSGVRVDVDSSHFRFIASCWPGPGTGVHIAGGAASFVLLDVSGLGTAPPDYSVASAAAVIAGWESTCVIRGVGHSSAMDAA